MSSFPPAGWCATHDYHFDPKLGCPYHALEAEQTRDRDQLRVVTYEEWNKTYGGTQ